MNKKKPRRKDNPKKKQNPISPPITSTQNKKLVWIVSFHITGKERIGLFGQEKEPFYCGGILIMKFTLHLKSTPKNYRSRHRELALRLKIR